ncbi:DMT family transporter [Methylotenera sp.]|uniref:DMT family transporter n=1 Tax=Methylotenera sp. TaxID=2051956 RepID=UPI0027358705|nr:DMT family transporter [Methylotenera sp.]MDP3307052.1 DMT family transporter [Methylotenera sp.]
MPTAEQSRTRTIWLTTLALIAFAANSLLCRLALTQSFFDKPAIDAASFSLIRLASGAITLWLIVSLSQPKNAEKSAKQFDGNWLSACMLFLYMVGFSFAYLSLSAGVGALILFGAVQATMLLAAILSGERPYRVEWFGLLLALLGLIYLVLPGLAAPPLLGSVFMTIAGVAWGFYSLRGRNVTSPLSATTGNFIRAVPLVTVVFVLSFKHVHISTAGALPAMLSGALASGVGYAIWYAALRGLSAARAATLQLAVPVLAAMGGVLFLSEAVSLRLVIAALMILGGVGLAVLGREYLTYKT